jgi:hypothetical protein
MAVMRRHARAILAGALPVLLITVALYAKNSMLFGSFNGSTWLGMQTAVMTTHDMDAEELNRRIASGELSPFARIPAFSPLPAYKGMFEPVPKTGVPVLDEETAGQHPNYNNLNYLPLHKRYMADSIAVVLHSPKIYLRALEFSVYTFFLPASDYFWFDDQRKLIRGIEYPYSAVFFGQFGHAGSRKELREIEAVDGPASMVIYTGLFLMIGLPLLCLWVIVELIRKRFTGPESVTLGFMLFSIAWVTAVTILLSAFENNRYRFVLDGYFLLFFALVLSSAIHKRWPRVLSRKQV